MSIKNELTQIYTDKQKQKIALKDLKNRYICIIYSGIVKNKSIKEIHKDLYNSTINKNKMLLQAMKFTSAIKKRIPKDAEKEAKYIVGNVPTSPTITMGIIAFDLIKKLQVEQHLSKEINETADTRETDSKKIALENALNSKNVFFLASSHDDSAEDHVAWQGLMYINKDWRLNEDLTKEVKQAIANYVIRNNIRSVQWVTDKPVYFITRPNCRHYFKEMQVKEVLTESVAYLTQKYDMHHEIGKRTYLQTLGDKKANAKVILNKYRERLKLHLKMKQIQNSPLIEKAIAKDRFLIKKWEEYIKLNTV